MLGTLLQRVKLYGYFIFFYEYTRNSLSERIDLNGSFSSDGTMWTPSFPKTDIIYACIFFFFFFKLRDVDCAATALFQTQQCGADAVMEVGGRGTTWPKTVLLKGLFAEPPACCCLPVVQWKQRCSLPPIHHQTAPFL